VGGSEMNAQFALIVVLIAGATLRMVDVVRGKPDPVSILPWTVAAFTLLAAGNILSLTPVVESVNRTLGDGTGRLLFNSAIAAGLFSLVGVVRIATGRRSRLRLELLACTATIVLLLAMTAMTPAAHRNHSLTSHELNVPTVNAFYVIGNAYFIYVYCNAALGFARISRYAPRVSQWGLRILTAGLTGLALTCFVRLVWSNTSALQASSLGAAVNHWNFAIANVATIAVCLGLCLPAASQTIDAVRLRARRRRQARDLAPLWGSLIAVFPELQLDTTGVSRRAQVTGLGAHRQLYRRYVECRDGLIRLSPYLDDVARSRGLDVERLDAIAVARLIPTAINLKPTVEDPDSLRSARRIAVLENARTVEDDVSILITIARHLDGSQQDAPIRA
jgi:hypothetical protein